MSQCSIIYQHECGKKVNSNKLNQSLNVTNAVTLGTWKLWKGMDAPQFLGLFVWLCSQVYFFGSQ